MKFKNGKEMYDYLIHTGDLYSPSLATYIFAYNDAQALCVYYLQQKEVVELIRKSKKTNECWSAHLGWGGTILDNEEYNDDEHRYSEDETLRNLYLKPSLEYCESASKIEDWQDVKWLNDNAVLSLKDDSLLMTRNISPEEFQSLRPGDKILVIYNTIYADECTVTGIPNCNGNSFEWEVKTDKGHADEGCTKVPLDYECKPYKGYFLHSSKGVVYPFKARPYDEAEYYTATSKDGQSWNIQKGGRHIRVIVGDFYEVVDCLETLNVNIAPRICHN